MKKTVLVLVLFALFATTSAFAADSSSGCGLGWSVSQKNSLLSSSVRSTTNTILPNTFSMTFGTSNCQQHSIVRNDKNPIFFVEANRDVLALESAQGEGEYLRSFAAVLGCDANFPKFSHAVQSHYSTLFPTDGSPAQLLMNVESLQCGATL